MAKELNEVLDRRPQGFQPNAYFGFNEDCAIIYFSEKECYGERIDENLTLFKSFEGDELVGCEIKQVVRRLDGLGERGVIGVRLEEKSLNVRVLLHLLASESTAPAQEHYEHLQQIAQGLRDLRLQLRRMPTIRD